jgi:hypothetical protein
VAKPPFQYTPTADPDWVIRCAYDPVSGHYDKDCQRFPASQVPMGTIAKPKTATGKKAGAKKKKATAKPAKRRAHR